MTIRATLKPGFAGTERTSEGSGNSSDTSMHREEWRVEPVKVGNRKTKSIKEKRMIMAVQILNKKFSM